MSAKPIVSREPDYFKKKYEENPDPWNFISSKYEHDKYSATIEMLDGRHFKNAFEIGCSIGVLTKMLAPICKNLLSVDIVETVLIEAATRCSGYDNVKFQNLQVPREWPVEQKFDLILLSEVLYFLTPEDIIKVAGFACKSMLSGGIIMLVNCTEQIDEPCNGDEAAMLFIQSVGSAFSSTRHIRCEAYRIDVLRYNT